MPIILGFVLVTNILEKVWWLNKFYVSLQLIKLKVMKNNSLMIILLLFASMMMGKVLYTNTFRNKESLYLIDSDSTNTEKINISDNFDYVYSRFKVFNPELDSSTVITFNTVCEHYRLDTTVEMLGWCVGQILLESGAKQYHPSSHPKGGQLVKSSGGAIGISQILPSTAYGYLKKYVTDEDIVEMTELGCTPFDNIISETCTKTRGIELSREWLKDETNNLILWGYIMRQKLNKRPNILKVLITYNAGTSGMNTYLNNGGQLGDHSYVKGIRYKLNYAEDKILMTSYNH